MWGYWLISSSTLGDAVDAALGHLQLTFAYSSIKKVIRGDQAFLIFLPPPDLPPNLKRFVVEREMGTAASLLEDIGGPDFHLSEFCCKMEMVECMLFREVDQDRRCWNHQVEWVPPGFSSEMVGVPAFYRESTNSGHV